jgi:hypothetical protein
MTCASAGRSCRNRLGVLAVFPAPRAPRLVRLARERASCRRRRAALLLEIARASDLNRGRSSSIPTRNTTELQPFGGVQAIARRPHLLRLLLARVERARRWRASAFARAPLPSSSSARGRRWRRPAPGRVCRLHAARVCVEIHSPPPASRRPPSGPSRNAAANRSTRPTRPPPPPRRARQVGHLPTQRLGSGPRAPRPTRDPFRDASPRPRAGTFTMRASRPVARRRRVEVREEVADHCARRSGAAAHVVGSTPPERLSTGRDWALSRYRPQLRPAAAPRVAGDRVGDEARLLLAREPPPSPVALTRRGRAA